jgi:hypothetical protein
VCPAEEGIGREHGEAARLRDPARQLSPGESTGCHPAMPISSLDSLASLPAARAPCRAHAGTGYY